jgi:hypothetical protein
LNAGDWFVEIADDFMLLLRGVHGGMTDEAREMACDDYEVKGFLFVRVD